MRRALIIGIDSNVGRALQEKLTINGWDVWGTSRREKQASKNVIFLDLENTAEFSTQKEFDVVYLCAGTTKIATCETNQDDTYKINVDAQLYLANYFFQKQSHVIYLSSNAVFDGSKPKYTVMDIPSPQTWYGNCKAVVERGLNNISNHIAIVRMTKILFSDYPLFQQWLSDLKNNRMIHPYFDLSFCPISIDVVTACLEKIAIDKLGGIIHLSGEDDVTYLDAAYYFAKMGEFSHHLINPISVFASNEKRANIPCFTSLDITKSKRLLASQSTSFVTTMHHLYGNVVF